MDDKERGGAVVVAGRDGSVEHGLSGGGLVEVVALFKGDSDIGLGNGETGIGDGSWVVNDLYVGRAIMTGSSPQLSPGLPGKDLHASRRQRGTYGTITLVPSVLLDLPIDALIEGSDGIRIHVGRLVKEHALDIDSRGTNVVGSVSRPSGVGGDVLEDQREVSVAVPGGDVPDGLDVRLGVEFGDLFRVTCVGSRAGAGAAVRVDDDDKVDLGIGVDAGGSDESRTVS